MSRPVLRIVSTPWSSRTRWDRSPTKARRQASIALIAPTALRSMQGTWTSPPTGSQVRPRLCSIPISAAFSICELVPPSAAARCRAGRGDRAGHSDLALAADFGPRDGGILLEQGADRGGGQEEGPDA